MRMMNLRGTVLGLMAALTLGACATTNYPSTAPTTGSASQGGAYAGYGVVQSIDVVRQDSGGIGGSGIGLGTVAGAVIGGVVGHQIGSGRGNTAATVVGAAGGAYVGHELENRQRQSVDTYRITVRMEDGSNQTLTQSTDGGLRVGDRVRIEGGNLQRY
jgi:outer membrane lipoprotein SlyB